MRVGGATACCSRTVSTTGAGASNVTIADVITAGAHGAMGWHPAGAQGKWQGVSSDEFGADCSETGISIPAMAPPACAMPFSACDIAGITHANPLPARMSWKKRPAEATAAKARKRRMVTICP